MNRFDVPVAIAICCFALSALAGPSQDAASNRALTLDLPRASAADEAIYLRLTVGVLPPHARLVVRGANKEILGTVAPYGLGQDKKAGAHMIPVPIRAVINGKVSLLLEIHEQNGTVRAPGQDEVDGATLILRPITRIKDQ